MYQIPFYGELTNRQLIFFVVIGLILAIIFYKGPKFMPKFLTPNNTSKYSETEVQSFDINVDIPDTPTSTAEGGFYLYFTSPDLKLRKLMSYQFDKNSTVSCNFDIRDRMVTFKDFKKMLPNMTIESRSKNYFHTSGINWSINLSNGRRIVGKRDLDENIKRNYITGPIKLEI